MITIKEMRWGNWFSYGDDNYINLNDAKVTQITGINGSGKSSIPVILGEILTNKNALGKVKAKLSNRYVDNKSTWAKLKFNKDDKEYLVDYSRKSTLKLALYEDGIDISSHSTTNTYVTLSNILGYDFKTIWGLIYQSSKEGLEFLTSTDTNRKKFLIKLFNLDSYLHIHENFKELTATESSKLLVLKGQLSTIESWIERNKKEDLQEKPLLQAKNLDKDYIDELANLKIKLANIHDSNKKINDNNQLKELLNELDTSILNVTLGVPADMEALVKECNKLQNLMAINQGQIDMLNTNNEKIKALEDKCPTCEQLISYNFKEELITNNNEKIRNLQFEIDEYVEQHAVAGTKRIQAVNLTKKKLTQDQVSKDFSDLISKIVEDLPSEIIIESEVVAQIENLSNLIQDLQDEITIINSENLTIEAHNSKVVVIKEQLIDYNIQFKELEDNIVLKERIAFKLNIIKKAFSTNGLLSYKIEHLSKDLEDQINIYLADLSKGRFQLSFTIAGEKLNVEIIDDGRSIGIEELSAGELARVNTSTLLAIRKLMAAISSAKINILFLDEITGVLDEEGKEVLIDILTAETELNTFLVSHEYTHPLIPQINVVKENKISRIEE